MNTVKYIHNEVTHNTTAAGEILPFVFEKFAPKSVLDVGCANGAWLKVCKDLGAQQILGIDGISVERKYIDESEFLQRDLRKPVVVDYRFDLAICLEVGEHLPADAAAHLVESLTSHSDVVLFSAAVPGQGGQYHINEQWPEYWHRLFKEKGFVAIDLLRARYWNNPNVLWWYKQNMIAYIHRDKALQLGLNPTPEVPALVHPDLYRKKIFHPKYLRSRNEILQSIWLSVKYFMKSFLKRRSAE